MSASEKSIAVIGASESTLWTYWALRNLEEYGYAGDIMLVNPNKPEVYGRKTYRSAQDLPKVPDLAILITNPVRTIEAARELVELGVTELICVSDGFRETATDEGRALEEQLVAIVAGKARLIGPNCVGYASFHDNLCAIAEPIPLGITPGPVSVLSQSGVLTHTALAALKAEGLGVDQIYSLGNGASFGFTDALNHLVQRDSTRVICGVIESITELSELTKAVTEGRKNGKEFVWLLLGQSNEGKRIAASHTGAIVGDQRIMRAKLNELGVVIVNSFDELSRTASLILEVGRPSPTNGVFFVTDSGGASGIAADTAAAYGLPLAQIGQDTIEIIQANILPGTTVGNPLDSTTHNGADAVRAMWGALAADPAVGILVPPFGMSWPDDSDERRWHRAGIMLHVDSTRDSGKKLIYSSLMQQPLSDFMVRVLAENPHVSVNAGFAQTVSSLANLYDHSQDQALPVSYNNTVDPEFVVDEAAARAILAGFNFQMVQGFAADTPQAAGLGARTVPGPWVAKVAVKGLSHKGRVGGVRLGIITPEDVEAQCEDITRRVVELGIAPASEVHFMVQQMVFGPEILVGLLRDAVAGPAAIIGVGGWAAETGTIFATIPLPASEQQISDVLLRGDLPRLIGVDKVTDLVTLVTPLAAAFTDGDLAEFDTVELNPVIMAATGPTIADALLVRFKGAPE